MSGLYKSYANKISKFLGIDIEVVRGMTVGQVDEKIKENFEAEVEERMKDEERLEPFRLLFPHYDVLYKYLGESLIRAYSSFDQKDFFGWTCRPSNKKVIKNDKYMRKNTSYSYYSGDKEYYVAEDLNKFFKVIELAINLEFPEFTKYDPHSSYIYGVSTSKVEDELYKNEISFDIFKQEIDENDPYEEQRIRVFCCSIASFLAMDWEEMLEDFLNHKNAYKIKSRDVKAYNTINTFLNTPEMAEFMQTVKNTKEKRKKAEG